MAGLLAFLCFKEHGENEIVVVRIHDRKPILPLWSKSMTIVSKTIECGAVPCGGVFFGMRGENDLPLVETRVIETNSEHGSIARRSSGSLFEA